jgi:cardiolipin synthase
MLDRDVKKSPDQKPGEKATPSAGPKKPELDKAAQIATTRLLAEVATENTPNPTSAARATMDALGVVMPTLSPVLAKLAAGMTPKPVPPLGSQAFEQVLDKGSHSQDRGGNTTKLLVDGAESFPERERLIKGAKHTIDIEVFIFSDDETGNRISDLLTEAAQRGVHVRLMYDVYGCQYTPEGFWDYLRKTGVEVRGVGGYKDVMHENQVNHVKSLIVDGQVAINGGMNFGNEYAYGGTDQRLDNGKEGFRDTDVEIAGPSVEDAIVNFCHDWAKIGTAVPAEQEHADIQAARASHGGGSSQVRYVEHRTREGSDDNTQDAYLDAIESTKSTIRIENAYFAPPAAVEKALIRAARRGVHVQVITNSLESTDEVEATRVSRYQSGDFLAAGIEVFESKERLVHSKFATFDGKVSIVGSVNLNGRSEYLDSENLAIITDPSMATKIDTQFVKDEALTRKLTPAELAKEPRTDRIVDWALFLVSRSF